jgi:serine/threonine protein kinase
MLKHEAVVRLYDSGSTPNEDIFFIIMQDCGGVSLDQQLDAGRLFTERVAVQIGMQVASGLGAIHELGAMHRDIKPANIIECFRSDPSRAIKYQIIDFGVAVAFDQVGVNTLATASTATGQIKVAGTPRYMSPEMLMRLQGREDGGEIGPAADIWSLGATLVHLVTGRVPWESNLGALFAFARSSEPVVDVREMVQAQVSQS